LLHDLNAWLIKHWIIRILLFSFIFALVLIMTFRPFHLLQPRLPNFTRIHDTGEKKAKFFAFLQPYIRDANAEIGRKRSTLLMVESRVRQGILNKRDNVWLHRIAREFGLMLDPHVPLTPEDLEVLLLRVDRIPPSLALAQAALESGWGTSRFARKGNNLFGKWCYEPGCGIVPRDRPAGATYELQHYRSPMESFADYIRNLNSNPAYESLWLIRAESRLAGEEATGIELADGIFRYSEEGWLYISKVKGVIRSNGLEAMD
jgi:Bax protein